MESEAKSKRSVPKSPPNDSIIRVLKYESDTDISSLPSKSKDSFSQQDKKMKGSKTKENPSFEEERRDKSTPKNQDTTSAKSGSQLATTPTKIKQEENILNKDKKEMGASDSSFTEFCKGLQLSPVIGRIKAPMEFTRHHSHDPSKQKNQSTHSHKTLFRQKISNNAGSNSAKKNIERLDLNNRLVFIRSMKNEINIQVEDSNRHEEDSRSEDNEDMNLSMHCSEDNLDMSNAGDKKMNTEYNPNAMKVESPHSEKPGKNQFFQQWDLLENTRTGFENNEQPEDFGTFPIEGMDTDGMARHVSENSQSFTFASLNSFSGQKTHLERVPIIKASTLDMNMNDMNQDSSSHKHAKDPFALGSEQKDGKKKIICNCKKSKCLKLYCDCFAAGEECGPECNCNDCCNHENHPERIAAVESTLERNPNAFKPKVDVKLDAGSPTQKVFTGGESSQATQVRHSKGCNCKKSGCLKKYCECFQAGIKCTELCKCDGCKNIDPATAMKKSRSMVMAGFGSQEMFMGFENSQSSFLGSVHNCHSRHAFFGRKGLDENIFEEEKEEDEEEDMDQLQKKRHIGNFNSYQTSTLLDDLISPSKCTTKLDDIIGIKVKNEETSSKKEEVSSKPERKRKKPQNEKKVKI